MASPTKRMHRDVMQLAMMDYEIIYATDGDISDFYVRFEGPKGSLYEGGAWKVHVVLPAQYPYKSPSIGFCNPIYHPNIDEASGSVCLDVINQTWSPMFSLVNVFETFLPQLLSYPEPSDPLNREAGALYDRNRKDYERVVRRRVKSAADPGSLDMSNDSRRRRTPPSPTLSEFESPDDTSDMELSDLDDDDDVLMIDADI